MQEVASNILLQPLIEWVHRIRMQEIASNDPLATFDRMGSQVNVFRKYFLNNSEAPVEDKYGDLGEGRVASVYERLGVIILS